MNDEAPEYLWISPRQAEMYAKPEYLRDPSDTQQYRRVDPPAAPKCPTCKSDDKDIRNLGCNGSYGILHDNCGTEPCPDAWHAPAPADERDKALGWQEEIALAKSIVSGWLSEKGIALTGVHGEVSMSTINRFKLDLAFRIAKALESARGKVEE